MLLIVETRNAIVSRIERTSLLAAPASTLGGRPVRSRVVARLARCINGLTSAFPARVRAGDERGKLQTPNSNLQTPNPGRQLVAATRNPPVVCSDWDEAANYRPDKMLPHSSITAWQQTRQRKPMARKLHLVDCVQSVMVR